MTPQPKPSPPAHPRVIAATCGFYPGCVYVEIGVGWGGSITQAAPECTEVHGVDVNASCEQRMPAGARFWNMTSDEFFRVYDGGAPNVLFIDGDHSYEQAKRDFANALELLAKAGVIFLHDTWPRTEQDTSPQRSGTVWKLAEQIARADELESFTFPRFPGLTAVRRRGEGWGQNHLRES